MQNVNLTFESEFANSPTLIAIIESFNAAIDPANLINEWYQNVWNIPTAQGYGLDVLGRIVGVGRVLQLTSPSVFFGFAGASGASGVGYNQAPFYNNQAPATTSYALSDDAFRILIYAKSLANICNASIVAINAVLMTLFSASGLSYVVDNENMNYMLYFTFQPTPVQVSIIKTSGVIPKPSGVGVTFWYYNGTTWVEF